MALRRPWKTREGGILIFYRSNFIKAEVRRKKSLLLYQEYYGKVLAFLFLYLKQRMLFRPQMPRGKKSGSASSYKKTCRHPAPAWASSFLPDSAFSAENSGFAQKRTCQGLDSRLLGNQER
jgi:hypothetical protein